jgi:glycine/D-amino acid oxidase-like deaminating enzyme
VIVGGGITGAGIAHVFAEAGVPVVLIEAGRVGRGSTAASTALLMQETDETLGALQKAIRPCPGPIEFGNSATTPPAT